MAAMRFTGGLPETPCGLGSTIAFTAPIRLWLPRVFHELGVKMILDAPCGDFNWMAHTDLGGLTYIGFDSDPQHCERALRTESRAGFAPLRKVIHCWDIIDKPIPCVADLMLSRDFWQHLPDERVHKAIGAYLESNIQWLMGTSHLVGLNNDIKAEGMYRPLNMTLEPFAFPAPRKMISDGHARILALWHRNDILHRPIPRGSLHPART